MNEDLVWVTVIAKDAPHAASAAVNQHGGHVQRLVPDRTPGSWHVQLAGAVGQQARGDAIESSRAPRSPFVLLALLVIAVVVAATLMVLDQRSTAAQWRDRSGLVEAQLLEQASVADELRTALEESEAIVSELEARVAALAADAADDADAAQAGE